MPTETRTTHRIRHCAGFVIAVTLFTILIAGPARAQASKDAARLLYDQALALFDQSEREADVEQKQTLVNTACDKFAAASEQMSGLGITINLARCRERQGRIASAWFLFKDALVLHKRAASQGGKKAGRLEYIQSRIAALEPELPYLTVDIASEHRKDDMQVHLGDTEIIPALWGSAVPADPGTHRLRVSAPGHSPYVTSLTLAPRQRERVEVPGLQPVATSGALETDAPHAEEDGLSGSQIGAVVVGSLGLAALTVGAVFGGLALSQWDEARERCPSSPCGDAEGATLDDDALVSGNTSTGLLIGGGTLIAAAVIWFVLTPEASEAEATSSSIRTMVPMLGPHHAGLLMTHRF